MQSKCLSLILVDEVDPAASAEDHLEPDAVEVHLVGHLAAVGDQDVRCDERTASPIG